MAYRAHPAPLHVSTNGRYLVQEDGSPFLYLGDTAWELFHRLTREETDLYLRNRAAKGFNVIQAVVLAELDGLGEPNAYGDLPLVDRDPAQPNERYFEQVDYVVREAAALGMYVAMLPTWGKYVTNVWGEDVVVLDAGNARTFGEFLGRRYADQPIIWVLGGDRPAEGVEPIWRAMAEGLAVGDGGRHLMTYHPQGGHSSAMWLHDEPWLSLNMLQSGHAHKSGENWLMVGADYARTPPKPCLDGEPNYEDHPVNWNPANGWFDDHDARQAAYWALFAGACGHTYGCQDIWQMYAPGRRPVGHARTPWTQALDLPGAFDMRHVHDLVLSRPFLTRIPDQGIIRVGVGGSTDHVQATRDGTPGEKDATYMIAYLPIIKQVALDTSVMPAERLRAWWFDPREGVATIIGEFQNTGTYAPPRQANGPDWVLVVDDVGQDYPPPGERV